MRIPGWVRLLLVVPLLASCRPGDRHRQSPPSLEPPASREVLTEPQALGEALMADLEQQTLELEALDIPALADVGSSEIEAVLQELDPLADELMAATPIPSFP